VWASFTWALYTRHSQARKSLANHRHLIEPGCTRLAPVLKYHSILIPPNTPCYCGYCKVCTDYIWNYGTITDSKSSRRKFFCIDPVVLFSDHCSGMGIRWRSHVKVYSQPPLILKSYTCVVWICHQVCFPCTVSLAKEVIQFVLLQPTPNYSHNIIMFCRLMSYWVGRDSILTDTQIQLVIIS